MFPNPRSTIAYDKVEAGCFTVWDYENHKVYMSHLAAWKDTVDKIYLTEVHGECRGTMQNKPVRTLEIHLAECALVWFLYPSTLFFVQSQAGLILYSSLHSSPHHLLMGVLTSSVPGLFCGGDGSLSLLPNSYTPFLLWILAHKPIPMFFPFR